MKVLYILNSAPRLSGSFKAFKFMLEGLIEKGIEPLIVVPRDSVQNYENILRDMGLPVFPMVYKFHGYPDADTWTQRLLFLPRFVARFYVNWRTEHRLAKMFRDADIALVHTNVGLIDVGRRVALRLGVPHVQHIREFGTRQFPSRAAFSARLRRPSSYSICITRSVQQYFRLQDESTSRVIYDGVHHRVDNFPGEAPGDYLLFAGIIHRTKGIDQVVQAYSSYATSVANPLPLKVAGGVADEALLAELQAQLAHCGLTEKVQFLGPCTDVSELMHRARAVVVASPVEGFGFCMPESQFVGTLVIGRDISGTHEQLENGLQFTGQEIALRYETTEQLVHCLRMVTDGFPDFLPMRQRAFQTVNEFYSIESHVQQVYQFYQDILSNETNQSSL